MQVDSGTSLNLQPGIQPAEYGPTGLAFQTGSSPPEHSVPDRLPAAAEMAGQLCSDASLQPNDPTNLTELTVARCSEPEPRVQSQKLPETASGEAGAAEHPVGSDSRAPERRRSPDLLNEFLQLTLQPPSTAQTSVAANTTPLSSNPELLLCQRLMVAGLPTPPTDSQGTQELPAPALSEEASVAAAAPSLSSMWQCSSATVWTLSPTAEDSELQRAQCVSPPQGGADDSNHSSPGMPPSDHTAASQQRHIAVEQLDLQPSFALQVPREGLIDIYAANHIVAPSGARDPAPAASSRCSGSVQNVPVVSASVDPPDGATACSSDAGTKSPSPDLSPLLMNFGQRRSSQHSQQSGPQLVQGGLSGNEPRTDSSGELDFRGKRHSSASGSSATPHGFSASKLKHPIQPPQRAWASATESGSRVGGPSSDTPTPVGSALSSHSQLLSPPDTGMTGDGETAQLQQQQSGAAAAAYAACAGGSTQEAPARPDTGGHLLDSKGLVNAGTGA